jgi:carbonic anhydrase
MSKAILAARLAIGTALALLSASAWAADGHGPHWTYKGEHGPQRWGELSKEFSVCLHGTEQSPIDIANPIRAALPKLDIAWRSIPANGVNNGHTIQVNAPPGSSLTLEGKRFELLQFHIHHPSEHVLKGKTHPLEIHFVHKAADGELAVVGVFLKGGGNNPVLAPVWEVMPQDAGDFAGKAVLDIKALLPQNREHVRYKGSLTTPPCSEVVNWIVFTQPALASPEQIGAFASIFPNNARPPQPLGRRYLLGSPSEKAQAANAQPAANHPGAPTSYLSSTR